MIAAGIFSLPSGWPAATLASVRPLTLRRRRLGWRFAGPINCLDAQDGQLLAMAVLSPIIFAPLFLENNNLGATRLLNNPCSHRSIGQGWPADRAYIAIADREHFFQSYVSAYVAGKAAQ